MRLFKKRPKKTAFFWDYAKLPDDSLATIILVDDEIYDVVIEKDKVALEREAWKKTSELANLGLWRVRQPIGAELRTKGAEIL